MIDGLGTGGAERSLAEMLPGLVSAGVVPTVVCLRRRPEGVEQGVLCGGTELRFVPGNGLRSRVRYLRSLISQERPALVHSTLFDSNLAARLAAWGSKVPVLTSLVNTPYDPARFDDPHISARSLRAVRLCDGWTARHLTAHFHAITHAVKKASIEELGVAADRITVVERGRDPQRLGLPSVRRRERARRSLGLSADDEVLLNVGRQEHQKGQLHLLEAMEILLPQRPKLIALVVGRTGHASKDLDRRLGNDVLRGRVRLLGYRQDVPELLAAADLFVFPSLWEGLGGALIEAMALGLPVVGSDIPAVREVLQEGGNAALVDPGSAGALAVGIRRLLDDDVLRKTFARRSRAIFEERFTLDRSVERMVSLYGRVGRPPTRLARPPGPSVAQAALARSPIQRVARCRAAQRLAVLAYHGVDDADSFARQLDWLVRFTRPVTLDDVIDAAAGRITLPDHAALVTFDDGQRSVLELGLPLLQERGIPAVVYVVAGLLGGVVPFWWREVEDLWDGGGRVAGIHAESGRELVRALKHVPDGRRRSALAELRKTAPTRAAPASHLEWAELSVLEAGGVAVGNHSLTHPCLPRAGDEVIRHEVDEAHRRLSEALGRPPRSFAYPNGDVDDRTVAAVQRAGYDIAFLFDHRLASLPIEDPLRTSRLRIGSTATPDRLSIILSGLHPALLHAAGRA